MGYIQCNILCKGYISINLLCIGYIKNNILFKGYISSNILCTRGYYFDFHRTKAGGIKNCPKNRLVFFC